MGGLGAYRCSLRGLTGARLMEGTPKGAHGGVPLQGNPGWEPWEDPMQETKFRTTHTG